MTTGNAGGGGNTSRLIRPGEAAAAALHAAEQAALLAADLTLACEPADPDGDGTARNAEGPQST